MRRSPGREVAHRHVAPAHRQDLVVGGDAHPVAQRASGRSNTGLRPVGKMRVTRWGCAVGADDARGLAHQGVDALPAVRGGDQGVAGHARVAGVDAPVLGAGVPLVDRGVVLDAGIGAGPGRVARSRPRAARRALRSRHLPSVRRLSSHSPRRASTSKKRVGHAHAVVGVLAGDRVVGLAVPVGVVLGEVDLASRPGRRAAAPAGCSPRAPWPRAPRGAAARSAGFWRGSASMRRRRSRRHAASTACSRRLVRREPADQRGDLLLLDHLPADEARACRGGRGRGTPSWPRGGWCRRT